MILPLLAWVLAYARQEPSPVTLKPYTLPCGLVISLPSQPKAYSKLPVAGEMYLSKGNRSAFQIASFPSGEESRDLQLGQVVLGALDKLPKGKLTVYKDVLLGGWPGVEYQIEGQPVSVRARCFAINDQIILVSSVYSLLTEPEESLRVLDSVALAPSTKLGAVSSSGLVFNPLVVRDKAITLEMPGRPKDEVSTSQPPFSITFHVFKYRQDLRVFLFTYWQKPPGAPDPTRSDMHDLLQATVKGSADDPNFTLGEVKTTLRDGNEWASVEFSDNHQDSGRVEALYLNGCIYQVMELGPNPWFHSQDSSRLFDSFKFTKTP